TGAMQLRGRFARVDIDPAQISRGPEPEIALAADAGLAVSMLLDRIPAPADEVAMGDGAGRAALARAGVSEATPPMYRAGQALLAQIRESLPEAVIVGDSAQPVY